jgi:release factor glutamine methyltransferase
MTVGQALRQAIAEKGLAPSEARMLLAHASGLSRVALIAHPERELGVDVQRAFEALVSRRCAGEPIAYLLGVREFYGLELQVSPAVLIPRPETELLVDLALSRLPHGGKVLDLGTGSGAVALAIKASRPDANLMAVDSSVEALALASVNARQLGLAVDFVEGDWFSPLAGHRFDLVVANPPYVADSDPHLDQGDLRFEPRRALASGPLGLDALSKIACGASAHLSVGGWLMAEHGHTQADEVRLLWRKAGFRDVSSCDDLAGIARCTVGQYYPE